MSEETQRKNRPWMLYLTLALALVVAALFGWRWMKQHREAAHQEQQAKQATAQRIHDEVEFNGGSSLKIRAFAGDPAQIHRGEKTSLCYSVVNATEVVIDPKPTDETWPSITRCVDVSPKKTTTYTLTASDGKGHKEQAQAEIAVK